MNVGKGGQIQDVLVDLEMTDGSMLLDGYERSVDLASGQLKSMLRGDVATLENLAFDMGSAGKFNLGGRFEIGDDWTLRDLQLDLNVPDMDAVLFSALWPQWAAPETAHGLRKIFRPDGFVTQNYHLRLILARPKGCANSMMSKAILNCATPN